MFPPSANLFATLTLWVLAGLAALGLSWWWAWPRTDYARHVGWPVQQTVPFSHQHHVAGLGLDCRFCHSSVETSADAGLPPTSTCMTCHSQVWTQAAMLAPVRASWIDGNPLVWNRVTALPDYVYFNHSIHIAKGVGCASCHGDVQSMSLTYQARSLTMQFCLDCHRDPGPQLRPAEALFDTTWKRSDSTASPEVLRQRYHLGHRSLTDCSICHR